MQLGLTIDNFLVFSTGTILGFMLGALLGILWVTFLDRVHDKARKWIHRKLSETENNNESD